MLGRKAQCEALGLMRSPLPPPPRLFRTPTRLSGRKPFKMSLLFQIHNFTLSIGSFIVLVLIMEEM